jgi:hypothetical protein
MELLWLGVRRRVGSSVTEAPPSDEALATHEVDQKAAAHLVVQEQLLLRNRHAKLGSDRLFDVEQCLLVLNPVSSKVSNSGSGGTLLMHRLHGTVQHCCSQC